MSVILETSDGFLLSHNISVNYILESSNFRLKQALFDIKTPFLMDSASHKMDPTTEKFTPERKRKRRSNDVTDEDDTKVMLSAGTVIQEGLRKEYFNNSPVPSADWLENNRTSRNIAKNLDSLGCLLEVSEQLKSENIQYHYLSLPDHPVSIDRCLPTLIKNPNNKAVITNLGNDSYIIPEQSSFILGDLSVIESILLSHGAKFDLIILDPPWYNKSVKRKKMYSMLSNEKLMDFPLQHLCNENCIVVVWSTNNHDQQNFITSKLFPGWSVKHLVDWHWVKVTTRGDFVIPRKGHKKTYERIFIGQYSTFPGFQANKINHRVIVSIPSSVHSHKPPLKDVIQKVFGEKQQCLELFARYLLPGWTSCGNEVLKFQNMNYYEAI